MTLRVGGGARSATFETQSVFFRKEPAVFKISRGNMSQELEKPVTHAVTNASPECPLLNINIDWDTVFIEEVGLTIEVVRDNNREKLAEIKAMAMGICAGCSHHYSETGEGKCVPGGHIWPGLAGSTILVNQRAIIPNEVKSDPRYDYEDF